MFNIVIAGNALEAAAYAGGHRWAIREWVMVRDGQHLIEIIGNLSRFTEALRHTPSVGPGIESFITLHWVGTFDARQDCAVLCELAGGMGFERPQIGGLVHA